MKNFKNKTLVKLNNAETERKLSAFRQFAKENNLTIVKEKKDYRILLDDINNIGLERAYKHNEYVFYAWLNKDMYSELYNKFYSFCKTNNFALETF